MQRVPRSAGEGKTALTMIRLHAPNGRLYGLPPLQLPSLDVREALVLATANNLNTGI